MAAAFNSPESTSTKALTQPRNCGSVRLAWRVICTGLSGAVLAQGAFHVLRPDLLAVVQACHAGGDNFLGLFLAVVLDEAVAKVLAVERVVDLGFLVVILQFGKVNDPLFAGILGLPIDL